MNYLIIPHAQGQVLPNPGEAEHLKRSREVPHTTNLVYATGRLEIIVRLLRTWDGTSEEFRRLSKVLDLVSEPLVSWTHLLQMWIWLLIRWNIWSSSWKERNIAFWILSQHRWTWIWNVQNWENLAVFEEQCMTNRSSIELWRERRVFTNLGSWLLEVVKNSVSQKWRSPLNPTQLGPGDSRCHLRRLDIDREEA